MGRGVSVPYSATVVTYIDVSWIKDEYDYEDMLMGIMESLKDRMPSLVMSLWIVPKDQYLALASLWIYRITHHVEQLGDLTKQGTMSNGVSVYKVKKK